MAKKTSTEPLSPDKLELLLPALRHVAEMAQKSDTLNREDLQLLLLSSDLEGDWAVEELERWGKVLTASRGMTDATKREAAERALMMRGVPEAPAKLAISIVAGKSMPSRLKVSTESLDLGTLSAGQSGSAELEVQGGPGQVVVESDQIHVTPLRFDAESTRIRVEARPLAVGVLVTTLKLVTADESVEVPVVAQWEEPVSAPPSDEAKTVDSSPVSTPVSPSKPPAPTREPTRQPVQPPREMPDKIVCPKCDWGNDANELYCQNPNGCLHKLVGNRHCPYCGRSVPAGKFCTNCGRKM